MTALLTLGLVLYGAMPRVVLGPYTVTLLVVGSCAVTLLVVLGLYPEVRVLSFARCHQAGDPSPRPIADTGRRGGFCSLHCRRT